MDNIFRFIPLNWFFITTTIMSLTIGIYGAYLTRKQNRRKTVHMDTFNGDTRILKLLPMFAVVIALIASIVALILVNQDGWWQFWKYAWGCGDTGITSVAGRFWFWDYPVNLTVSQKSIPLLKDPALLSWLQLVFGIPAAWAAFLGLMRVGNNLNSLALSFSEFKNYSLGISVVQNGAEQKYADPIYKFIENLKDKDVIIRLISEEKPITGKLKDHNPHAVIIEKEMGNSVVFKHSIATIEPIYVPK